MVSVLLISPWLPFLAMKNMPFRKYIALEIILAQLGLRISLMLLSLTTKMVFKQKNGPRSIKLERNTSAIEDKGKTSRLSKLKCLKTVGQYLQNICIFLLRLFL